MLHLVYGGSGSGKSGYGETLAVDRHINEYKEGRLIYLATMYPYLNYGGKIDDETAKRIERHRNMRKNKGFETVECYTDIAELEFGNNDVILLECMSNLLANEMFLEKGNMVCDCSTTNDDARRLADEHIVGPLLNMAENAGDLIIVTNGVFSGGDEDCCDEKTKFYIRTLGYINQRLAGMACNVIEVVCGIPIMLGNTKEK